MRFGKAARIHLLALCAGLTFLGCAGPRSQQQPALVRAQGQRTGPGLRVPAPPAPELRIPEPPTPVQTPPENAPPITPASGQQESGPVLTPPEPAAPGAAAADPLNQLRRLYQQASQRYAGMDSYIVRLRRREQVNGKNKPEEILLFKFRKNPWSVHLKWLGAEGKGREVVYVKGHHDDKIHTRLAAGDMPFAPAGKRIALAPDSFLVRSASRHAITEAGVGALIDHFGETLAALERGDKRHGTLAYLGLRSRPEYPTQLEAVEQQIPPGGEPGLPRGGRRQILFDPGSHLPVMVITLDENGQEVEYYCYDRFQYPVRLDDDDFNPDKLWASPQK